MNKHIRESVDEYDLLSVEGVYPISEVDGKIIHTLTEILTQMDANKKFLTVFRDWKRLSDEDIHSQLEQFQGELAQDIQDSMKRVQDWVTIEGIDISLSTLFSIQREETYDSKKMCPVYTVLLNKTENPNVINGNTEISYLDFEDRDEAYLSLRNRLKEFTNIRFL